MKKLSSFIIYFLLSFLLFSFMAPFKFDFGIQILSKEDDYTLMYIRYPFYSSTVILNGEFPKAEEIPVLEHKRYDEYHNLNEDEKLVYNAILNRAFEIFSGTNYSLDVRIPIDSFVKEVDIRNVRTEVEERIDNIDYQAVFKALRSDYNWLFWFEENMAWTVYSPDLKIEGGNLADSSFVINIEPMEKFKGDNKLNDYAQTLVEEANNRLMQEKDKMLGMSEDEKILEIKKIIIDSVEYDYEESESIEKGIHDENTAKATSAMNFLTEEGPLMVCEGYSNVFQMYSDLLGLETYSKTGIMNTEDINTKHAWNIVYVDDKKMLVDLTNSEAGTVGYRGDLFMKEVEGIEYDVLISGRNISYKENVSR